MSHQRFWLDDIKALCSDCRFIPMNNMDKDEKLNSLTRLAIIISIAMFASNIKYWLCFLLFSVLIIVVIKYHKKFETEGFSVTPTYQSTDFNQTIVSPTFAEEWNIIPPTYDLQESVPEDSIDMLEPLTRSSYPYGQYLSTTNLLPSDEYNVRMSSGLQSAKEYANSSFLRNDLAFKENMTRIYRKKLNRRFRNSNCGDSFSPFSSY